MKRLYVSPSSMGDWLMCPFKYWLGRVKKYRMGSNVNFAVGGGLHSTAEYALKTGRDKATPEQLKAAFAGKWNAEFSKPMYLKDRDNPEALFQTGLKLVDLFVEQFIDRKFPFDPIDYVPVGKSKAVPAAELSLTTPAINIVTGEELKNVSLTCIIDSIGMHDEWGLSIVDWKTGARAFSPSKIEKGIQLAHNALSFRLARDLNPGMFPTLEAVGKRKEDQIAYLLFKKLKVPVVEKPYHKEVTDANIEFFWRSLKDFVKAIEHNIFPYCEGNHCSSMCSLKPICDAIQNGEDPDKAHNDFMLQLEETKKERHEEWQMTL